VYRVFLLLSSVVSLAVSARSTAVVSSYEYSPNLTKLVPLNAVPAEDTEMLDTGMFLSGVKYVK
jgi:hypothetical protein